MGEVCDGHTRRVCRKFHADEVGVRGNEKDGGRGAMTEGTKERREEKRKKGGWGGGTREALTEGRRKGREERRKKREVQLEKM